MKHFLYVLFGFCCIYLTHVCASPCSYARGMHEIYCRPFQMSRTPRRTRIKVHHRIASSPKSCPCTSRPLSSLLSRNDVLHRPGASHTQAAVLGNSSYSCRIQGILKLLSLTTRTLGTATISHTALARKSSTVYRHAPSPPPPAFLFVRRRD